MSRSGSRAVVATSLLILAACAGPDRDPSSNGSAPQSGIQAIVGIWCDPQGGACLVIAPDGSVDDDHGPRWLTDRDTATIAPLSGSRFALKSSASTDYNELELSPDGKQLTSVLDGESYVRHQ